MRLAGKIAIVTGGAYGIGEAIVRRLAGEGAAVLIADVLEEEGEALSGHLRAAGMAVDFVATDVTSEASWSRLIAAAKARHGRLDILVNNAGISGSGAVGGSDLSAFQKLLAVNTQGAFLGVTQASAAMADAGGGSIVNIASITARMGSTSIHLGYHASKSALVGFARAAACRLGPAKVRINTIFPGFFHPMRGSQIGTYLDDRIAQTPLRRLGAYDDVANGVLYLASDEAAFVTGAELVIDGGYLARD